jgi:ferredoxin
MITLGIGKINPKRCEPSPAVLKALCETVAWCLSRSVHSDLLRSRELNPSEPLRVSPYEELGIDVWIEEKRKSYKQAIYAINEKRSTLLRDAQIEISDLATAQSKGKLLLYEPLETVADGAAAVSSKGFFDVDEDAPPWDTWFLFSGNAIFCWVPESLVQDAQDGIDANPVDCIHWRDWSDLSEQQDT